MSTKLAIPANSLTQKLLAITGKLDSPALAKEIAANTASLSLASIVENAMIRQEPTLNKLVATGSMERVVATCSAMAKRFIRMNFTNSEESISDIVYDFINDLLIDHAQLTVPDVAFFFKYVRQQQGINPEFKVNTNVITGLQLTKWLNLYLHKRGEHQEDHYRRLTDGANRTGTKPDEEEKYVLMREGRFVFIEAMRPLTEAVFQNDDKNMVYCIAWKRTADNPAPPDAQGSGKTHVQLVVRFRLENDRKKASAFSWATAHHLHTQYGYIIQGMEEATPMPGAVKQFTAYLNKKIKERTAPTEQQEKQRLTEEQSRQVLAFIMQSEELDDLFKQYIECKKFKKPLPKEIIPEMKRMFEQELQRQGELVKKQLANG